MRIAVALVALGAALDLNAIDLATFGPGGRFRLEYGKDDFGIRSHGVIETLSNGRTRFYPLPQSSVEKYVRLRSADLPPGSLTAHDYERQEVIGPHQVEGGKLWFGNSYYHGEGMRGVGAFGYFDTATRSYTLFSPPEVAGYETSAILVEADRVWIGLDWFGEDISTSPGGLVEWDRRTHEVHRYPLEFVVDNIRVEGDSLRLITRNGYALFRDGNVRRFTNGRRIAKFPPSPSNN